MDAVGRFKKGSPLAEKAEKVFLTHMVSKVGQISFTNVKGGEGTQPFCLFSLMIAVNKSANANSWSLLIIKTP